MWQVALISVVVATALELGIFLILWAVAVPHPGPNGGPAIIDPLDVIKTTIAVAGSVGAVLVGVYGYRKQSAVEADGRRADAEQLAQRYTTAAGQLGHEKAAVRLAGVYAMARLADDWNDQRQVCIDVLCAYLRMPYETDTAYREGEREVRRTIIRIIRDHLRDPAGPTTWRGRDFDFSGAEFDGGDFSHAKFTSGAVRFDGAKFTGGLVSFNGAEFNGASVSFSQARFAGALVSFEGTEFTSGPVNFLGAEFTRPGGVLFHKAKFNGAMVQFFYAKFTSGPVAFLSSEFTAGEVSFFNAEFNGGKVTFHSAEFAGSEITFDDAKFTRGDVSFDGVKHTGGRVSFDNAEFTGSRITWGPIEPPLAWTALQE